MVDIGGSQQKIITGQAKKGACKERGKEFPSRIHGEDTWSQKRLNYTWHKLEMVTSERSIWGTEIINGLWSTREPRDRTKLDIKYLSFH